MMLVVNEMPRPEQGKKRNILFVMPWHVPIPFAVTYVVGRRPGGERISECALISSYNNPNSETHLGYHLPAVEATYSPSFVL